MKDNMNDIKPNLETITKIKERMKQENPRGRNYARFLSGFKIILIITAIVVGVMALSLFLVDILVLIQGSEFENRTFFQNIPGFLLGLLSLSLLAVAAVYIIYRHTDWPFVKERFKIVIAIFCSILFLASATVFLSEKELTPLGNYLDDLKDTIELKTPIKSWLEPGAVKDIRTIEGTINSIQAMERDGVIVVSNGNETETLTLDSKFGQFSVGDKVRIKYQVDGSERDIEMIELLN